MSPSNTIAILSPGEMGSAVGRVLHANGKDVITCLVGRSQRTHDLARQSGFRTVPTLDALVREAGLILSILVPSEAITVAQQVAQAMRATGRGKPFADCNAVSPQTAHAINDVITQAGGLYVDASIIGGPPSGQEQTRLYVSGPDTSPVTALDGLGIQVKGMGDGIGRAKAIKMCYGGMTKGTTALYAALLTVAEVLGVSEELHEEFAFSQADVLPRFQGVKRTPAVAGRWIGEMEEIAATFAAVGVTPHFHQGAAEVYRMVAASPLGKETPETLDPNRTQEEVIRVFAEEARRIGGDAPAP